MALTGNIWVVPVPDVLSTVRLGAAEPAAGQNLEIYAIASAIIGGTTCFWGQRAHSLGGGWRPYQWHDQQWPEHAPHPNVLPACGDGKSHYRGSLN